MSPQPPTSLERLARANPVEVDEARGRTPQAQAALTAILAAGRAEPERPRRTRSVRVTMIAFAAVLVGAGAAVAATDPFGFWRSSQRDTARYQVDASRHVRTPTAQFIACTALRCRVGGAGQRYELTDHLQAPPAMTRAGMLKALNQEVQRGQVSAADAQRFRTDLAAVPDSFLKRFWAAMRFGTYGGGDGTVPPRGVPMWLACDAALHCHDLNGDEHAAVGSGVYMALPAKDWVRAGADGGDPTGRLMRAVFGKPTPAEARLLVDLLSAATVQSSSSSSGRPAPVGTPPPR